MRLKLLMSNLKEHQHSPKHAGGSYADAFHVLWHYRTHVFFDDKQHHEPHIHIEYGDEQAVIGIIEGGILAGYLSASKLRLVRAWIEIHRDELNANWRLAVNGSDLFKVDPLKQDTAMNPHVQNVEALDDYQLALEFKNGEHRIFDLKPYLGRGIFVRLQNEVLFQAARVVAGSIEWPGGLDLSYDTLYWESVPVETFAPRPSDVLV